MKLMLIASSQNLIDLIGEVLGEFPLEIQTTSTIEHALHKLKHEPSPDFLILIYPNDRTALEFDIQKLRTNLVYNPIFVCARDKHANKEVHDPLRLNRYLQYPLSGEELLSVVTNTFYSSSRSIMPVLRA
ncbi:hypothetical protein [Catenovulum sediminis]|uniref:Response regulatory domain-containing protein n=1 Tax=Catenovulum sediminis TaxID=1740262 RepID=A0ABV1RN30_9ALTE|nr:hypothetical protein [Catenovulum sediminis]